MYMIKRQSDMVVGRNNNSIGIGDGSVVTKMRKKKKEITFSYVSSGKEYTSQQLEQFKVKEAQLINYIIDQLMYKEAPSK
jgi:hypothetical protein